MVSLWLTHSKRSGEWGWGIMCMFAEASIYYSLNWFDTSWCHSSHLIVFSGFHSSFFFGVLQTVKVLRYNKCSSLSLIRLPWKCGIVIQAVQHLHINGVSGGGIWGSAETEWDMQGANFHIHQCASAKFRSYFQYFTSQTISPLKNKKYKFSTCKISYLDLAPDRNLVRWRLRVQPEHWQAVWCSVGHPTQFPRCQAHCKQQAEKTEIIDAC